MTHNVRNHMVIKCMFQSDKSLSPHRVCCAQLMSSITGPGLTQCVLLEYSLVTCGGARLETEGAHRNPRARFLG